MYNMMNGGTMWGMGSAWFLFCVLALLGAAVLVGYLFFNRRG
jgi:hypothetical protein